LDGVGVDCGFGGCLKAFDVDRLWSECWMLMELDDMSSVSMSERPSLLYIIRLETNALYTAVS
jgi:hypothetical protein